MDGACTDDPAMSSAAPAAVDAPQNGIPSNIDDGCSIASASVLSYGTSRSRNSRGYVTNGVRQRRRDDGRYHQRGRDFRSRSRSASRGVDFPRNNHNRGGGGGFDRDHRIRSQSYDRGGNRPYRRPDGPPGRGHNDSNSMPRRSRSASGCRNRSRSRGRSQSRGGDGGPGRPSVPPNIEWPPCFAEAGTSFVFDPRSAMFYESESNFFYDPKSKLYYGNKKAAYFRYDETADPPFVEVKSVAPSPGEAQDTTDACSVAESVAAQGTTSSKPAIAINIKAKKASKKKPETTPKPEPVVPKIKKQQAAFIEKWTVKQAELKAQTKTEENKNTSPTTPGDASTTTPTTTTPRPKVKTTSRGEPICMICKRKFATLEKLALHEKVSSLHKENLEKLELARQAAKRKEAPETTAEYQDRAQKRRDLHGVDEAAPNGISQGRTLGTVQPVVPADTLGKDNIGNKLLTKLGWKAEESKEGAVGESVRKDWDQIEARAGAMRPPR